jgi:hypothetical protein
MIINPISTSGVQAAMDAAKKLQAGDLPATADVVKVLESTEAAIDSQKAHPVLDEKGKTVLRDTENLIGAAKDLIQKKNVDEKLQHIVKEAQLASETVSTSAAFVSVFLIRASAIYRLDVDAFTRSVGKERVLSDAEIQRMNELKFKMLETAQIARDVLQLIVSSGEFRMVLSTLLNMARTIFGDVTETIVRYAPVL